MADRALNLAIQGLDEGGCCAGVEDKVLQAPHDIESRHLLVGYCHLIVFKIMAIQT